jgi:hypothetical protein
MPSLSLKSESMEAKFVKISKDQAKVLITASAALSNLFRLAPYFHNKCQKTQLDLFIGYTQEAKSGNAEPRVLKISCAASPQVA